MTDSQQPRITSYGSQGNRGRYALKTPPPAAHISYKPEMVGAQYGWVKVIIQDAQKAVREKRKNWRGIQRRLASMTLKMPDQITVLPYRGNSSTTADMAAASER